jgi:hypothetical protein
VGQEPAEHHRGDDGRRDAVLLDEVEDPSRLELGDDRVPADERRHHAARPGPVDVGRQAGQEPLVGLQLHRHGVADGRQRPVVVAEHGALGPARRAAGVADDGDVTVVDRNGPGRRGGRDEVLVVVGAAVITVDPDERDVEVGRQCRPPRAIGHPAGGPAVGRHVGQLRRAEPVVDRHDDEAALGAGELQLPVAQVVAGQHRHPVAGRHAERGEGSRQATRPVIDHPPRHRGRARRERRVVAPARRLPADDVGDVHRRPETGSVLSRSTAAVWP